MEPRVYHRPAPVWTIPALVGGLLLYVVGNSLATKYGTKLAALFPPGLPIGPWAVRITVVVSPFLVYGAVLAWLELARRRYGMCELNGTHATFYVGLTIGPLGERTVDLRRVTKRQATRHGVLLTIPGSFWARKTFIVPTDEAGQAEVFAHLDALASAEEPPLEASTLEAPPPEEPSPEAP